MIICSPPPTSARTGYGLKYLANQGNGEGMASAAGGVGNGLR